MIFIILIIICPTEYVLLKSCLSLPNYPSSLGALTTASTSRCSEALTRILGTPMDDTTWQHAKLPTHMGGLGSRAARYHAPAAYAASLLSCQPIVHSLLEEPQEPPAGDGNQHLSPPTPASTLGCPREPSLGSGNRRPLPAHDLTQFSVLLNDPSVELIYLFFN